MTSIITRHENEMVLVSHYVPRFMSVDGFHITVRFTDLDYRPVIIPQLRERHEIYEAFLLYRGEYVVSISTEKVYFLSETSFELDLTIETRK